jgi:hypothetical protein
MYSLQTYIFKSLPESEQKKILEEFFNISGIKIKNINPDYGFDKNEPREVINKKFYYIDLEEFYRQDVQLYNKYQVVKFIEKSNKVDKITQEIVDLSQTILNIVLKKFIAFSDGIEGYKSRSYFVYFSLETKNGDNENLNEHNFDHSIGNKPKYFFIKIETKYYDLESILLNPKLTEKFMKIWGNK